jgi:hypothetical protein
MPVPRRSKISAGRTMPACDRTGRAGIFPADVEVAEAPGGQDKVGRPFTKDLVGDPVSLQACVPCLRRWHSPSNPIATLSDSRAIRGIGSTVLPTASTPV